MPVKRKELTEAEKAARYDAYRERSNANARNKRKEKREQKAQTFLKYFKEKYES